MPRARSPFAVPSLLLAATGVALALTLPTASCSSSSGPVGPQGAPGPEGQPGGGTQEGEGRAASCTIPCHGFGYGLVAQWRLSKHYQAQALAQSVTRSVIAAGNTCGNCHAMDGIERRVRGLVAGEGDAGVPAASLGHLGYVRSDGGVATATYTGSASSSQIHCKTCHAYDDTTDPHLVGAFVQVPLHVPFGDELPFLERSAGGAGTGQPLRAYGSGNACIFCHKASVDLEALIPRGASAPITPFWGPHEGPQTDIYSGKGGYEFGARTYASSRHAELLTGCTTCHMPRVPESGNLPDHTFQPHVSACQGAPCHADARSFDIAVAPNTVGAQTQVRSMLAELKALLGPDGLNLLARSGAPQAPPLTDSEKRDTSFHLDTARAGGADAGRLDADTLGALYNYLLVARGGGAGVHNPIYTKQLLWDSIAALKSGQPPSSMPERPRPLPGG